jgi:hypothetical protein
MRTDMDLAVLQRALQVQYPNEILAEIIERLYDQRNKLYHAEPLDMPALEDVQQPDKTPAIFVQQIAMMRDPSLVGRSIMTLPCEA